MKYFYDLWSVYLFIYTKECLSNNFFWFPTSKIMLYYSEFIYKHEINDVLMHTKLLP